jgi:integrase
MAKPKSSARTRLTKMVVEALPVPAIAWDSDLRGFGCRVSPKGARAYFVHGRTPGGRQVKVTIGRHGQLTAEQARARAKQLLGAVATGADPAAEKRQARQAEKEIRDAPTIAELMARYLVEHAERRKRPSSISSDRLLINKHILPAFGSARVGDITHGQVERLHGQISVVAPIAANRAIALLSKAMGLAVKWSWRADNPCKGIERNPEERRERFLAAAELVRLRDALNRRQDDLGAACIAFLMVTGARRGETLTARWQDFDPVAGVWPKPSSHTKQKRVHRVPLNSAARGILDTLASGYAPVSPPPDRYVFGGLAMVDRLRSTWEQVRAEAALPGLRLHDLRHAYASVLASGGLSLPIIGALLGHTAPATTARYAHLLDDALREATERVAGAWQVANGGRP